MPVTYREFCTRLHTFINNNNNNTNEQQSERPPPERGPPFVHRRGERFHIALVPHIHRPRHNNNNNNSNTRASVVRGACCVGFGIGWCPPEPQQRGSFGVFRLLLLWSTHIDSSHIVVHTTRAATNEREEEGPPSSSSTATSERSVGSRPLGSLSFCPLSPALVHVVCTLALHSTFSQSTALGSQHHHSHALLSVGFPQHTSSSHHRIIIIITHITVVCVCVMDGWRDSLSKGYAKDAWSWIQA